MSAHPSLGSTEPPTRRGSTLTRRLVVTGITVLTAAASVVAGVGPASAQPKHGHQAAGGLGDRSLASVLAADGSGFDRNPNDFDIATAAIQAVLKADPNSPVKVLADGDTPLTAFLPTDRAFEILAGQLSGRYTRNESATFSTLAKTLGVPTIESVLLYHVVPGATIDYRSALRANGARLSTALSGKSIKVEVRYCFFVQLGDLDPDARDPLVVEPDINRGNKQIAHGIDRVLRPVDL